MAHPPWLETLHDQLVIKWMLTKVIRSIFDPATYQKTFSKGLSRLVRSQVVLRRDLNTALAPYHLTLELPSLLGRQ